MQYAAFLTHPAGQFKGTGTSDHDAVMQAYESLKAAWSIDPWDAKVTVYQGESLCYVCRSMTAYLASIS